VIAPDRRCWLDPAPDPDGKKDYGRYEQRHLQGDFGRSDGRGLFGKLKTHREQDG
jgi:hypothetical protein